MLLVDKIIGHAKQIEALLSDYTTGNLAHAYLFHGPAHTGKYTLAKNFANLLQCEQELCGICSVCRQFGVDQNPDTIFMPDLNTDELIKIEEIRALIAKFGSTKQSAYKICLIEGMERMTREASNAFLKILEEPTSDTIFLLTSNALARLLPTITSRCRLLRFPLLDNELIKSEMVKTGLGLTEENREALRFAEGRPGRVIKFLRDPELLSLEKQSYLDLQDLLRKSDLVERFQHIGELSKNPQAIKLFLSSLLFLLREELNILDPLSDQGKIVRVLAKISKVHNVKEYLKQSVNPKLALENLILEN